MAAVRGWQLSVDWSGGGGLTGPLEDVTNYVNREPVSVQWGRPTDGLSQTAPTSQLDFALINRTRSWDRWFSPENTSSPIYGKVLPGKRTILSRTVQGGATFYRESVFTGLAGYAAVSGGTLTRVTTPSEDGDGALQYVPPGSTATVGVSLGASQGFMLLPAGQFIVYFRVRASASFSDAQAVIDWYDSTGALLSTGSGPTTSLASATWTTVQSLYLTPPATAVAMRPRLRLGSTPPNTTTFNIDWVSVWHSPSDADKTYSLYDGILDDLSINSQDPARTFTGTALDAWGRSDSATLSTPVYPSIRSGDAINVILDAVGWTGGRQIDAGNTIIPYWWEEGTDPAEAVDRVVRSEGPPAIAYIEAGTFVFRDRHHRTRSPASTTSQGLFTLLGTAGSGPGYDFKVEKGTFEYDHGIKSIANTARFSVGLRRRLDYTEIWSQEDPIGMDAGDVLNIYAEPSDPAMDVITPTYDNGDLQFSGAGVFTAALDRTSGQKFTITITCTSTGYISRLALRGHPVPVTRTVQVSSVDPGSVSRYGSAAWPDDLPWCNTYDAQAIADRIVAVYSDNRPRVQFTVVAFNARYLSKMLSLRISDRITVRNDVLGINRDFHIEQLRHSVDRWQTHRLAVSAIAAEPVQTSNAFTFGVAGRGFDQGTFGLNGVDNASTMFLFDNASQGFNAGLFAN